MRVPVRRAPRYANAEGPCCPCSALHFREVHAGLGSSCGGAALLSWVDAMRIAFDALWAVVAILRRPSGHARRTRGEMNVKGHNC